MIPRYLFIAVSVLLAVVVLMGIYLRHMRRRAAEMEPVAAASLPAIPPIPGPMESVTLYVADDSVGMLRPVMAKTPLVLSRQQRAEDVLRALVRIYQRPGAAHALSAAADIRGVYLVDPGAAVIDLNAAFADQHRSGILSEQLTVNSLIQTLASNVPGIQRVNIVVGGEMRETLAGHTDLTQPFDVITVQAASSQ